MARQLFDAGPQQLLQDPRQFAVMFLHTEGAAGYSVRDRYKSRIESLARKDYFPHPETHLPS